MKSQFKGRGQGRSKAGFTLIELLVVIAIIAILASILFPVFARARENARRSSCASNLKQIGIAAAQYTQDYDEYMVPWCTDYRGTLASSTNTEQEWFDLIQPYIKSTQVLVCPSDPNKLRAIAGYSVYPSPTHLVNYASYNMNAINSNTNTCVGGGSSTDTGFILTGLNGLSSASPKLSVVESSSTKIFIVDGVYPYVALPTANQYIMGAVSNYCSEVDLGQTSVADAGSSTATAVSSRHLGGFNSLYADGHVKFLQFGRSKMNDWYIRQP